jgi:AcrR family transcriptional regulator
MSGKGNNDRRSVRRQATIDEILDAAWAQVRERGLAGLAMRELGDRVGMRAQSLYSYFASKDEIYDAMFRQGNAAFVEAMQEAAQRTSDGSDPVVGIRRLAHVFVDFCVSDPVRYQLLFQRTIPDFVPSPDSYAVAQTAYAVALEPFDALGIPESGVDMWTALLTGLVAQQLANDPGGERWVRLVDDAVDLLIAGFAPEHISTEAI